jgi:hypothetical protein
MDTKTKNPQDGIAPALFELGEDEVLETLDDLEASEVVKATAAPAAQPQAQPQLQPQQQAAAGTAQPVFAEPEAAKPINLGAAEEVHFGTEDVLEGALMTRNERAGAVDVAEAGHADEGESDDKGILPMLMKNYKLVLGGVALAAVGLFMIPSSKVPAPVAQPVAVQAPTPAPTATPTPGTGLDIPAQPGGQVATDNPALDIASMGASPDDQSRLSAEMDKDLQAIPPQEQTCSNPALTSYEQRQCTRYTAQMFFKCTEGAGRRWNVGVAGCEQI